MNVLNKVALTMGAANKAQSNPGSALSVRQMTTVAGRTDYRHRASMSEVKTSNILNPSQVKQVSSNDKI